MATTHNEVVVDDLKIKRKLPEAIEAFFFMSPGSKIEASRAHETFLREFSLSSADCPLVLLKLDGTGDPFEL